MPASPVATPATGVDNRDARRSLILGVISVPAAMVAIGALTGVIAIVLGITGWREARNGAPRGREAIGGIALGVIAVTMVVLYFTVGN